MVDQGGIVLKNYSRARPNTEKVNPISIPAERFHSWEEMYTGRFSLFEIKWEPLDGDDHNEKAPLRVNREKSEGLKGKE